MIRVYEIRLPNDTTSYAWFCREHARGVDTGKTTQHGCDTCGAMTFEALPLSKEQG